ncbi:putative reverse transcriptase domain-containing protein [Tanacetum coccineum]
MGGRAGRGSGRTGSRSGDQGNGRNDGQGGQVGGQGSEVNDGVNGVPDFSNIIAQKNVIENNDRRGCTYKEFLAYNPKEYEGKGGAVVYTRWIEKIESVQDMSGCREVGVGMSWYNFKVLMREEFCHINEMQKLETKLWNHAMVGAGHAAYTDRFHELARSEGWWQQRSHQPFKKAVQIASTLTDEAFRNGSIKKNPEKRGNGGESSKDMNGRDDNKRTRTENAFATTTNPVRRENTGAVPKVVPRNVNPINARNPTARACYEYGSTDHVKAACPSLVSTTFIPLLGLEPSDLGFSYEIEIASGQLVKIDKVIKGCKLEIEGHVFDINLIPFGCGSFDVIIGMDWLSNHKAEINCHEKVVRIPLPDGKVLRVIGERPDEKVRHLVSAKAKEQKREELVVVRDFLEVFPDDLSGLPPSREIEFHIELVPGVIPVAKSPYRLAPSEMEELSGQLKEL